MTKILYPTRGGKESHLNQDFVINLAKERGAELLFMYVSNIQLISRSGAAIVVDIAEELDELGDFLLSMAQERAEKSGVLAKTTVRRGLFSKVLKEVVEEEKINTVVLGSSSQDAGIVSYEHLQELGTDLSTELSVEFIIVQDGKIVFQTGA